MGRKKALPHTPKQAPSPAVRTAKQVAKKYKSTTSSNTPRIQRVRRALYAVNNEKVSIRKAAIANNVSYGFLQRRVSGEVSTEHKNGPLPVFNKAEEQKMALWLSEMASRGMGLKPSEFLDFVQNVVQRERRKTPFKDGRPGYDWYHAFLERNSDTIQKRKETSLELCRAKLSKSKLDNWYLEFRSFLLEHDIIDKPNRIWNADETGFSMGSVASTVIGPSKNTTRTHVNVPHVTGGSSKQRFTVMFCASASGIMMPPFFVYPSPKPRGYNPLTGSPDGSSAVYTKKGWMDSVAFCSFIEHFDQFCGKERPALLLIDSVSSHVNLNAFELAKEREIELYRIVPNATHLMQPLDKGVFGPLKTRWHQVVRKHNRDHPGVPIGKETFGQKLKETLALFYKPLTIVNSFKSSGIYPCNSTVISDYNLKPGMTYTKGDADDDSKQKFVQGNGTFSDDVGATQALQSLSEALSTPTRQKYWHRIQEGYDVVGESPCFDTYRKLYNKCHPQTEDTLPSTSSSYSSSCSSVAFHSNAAIMPSSSKNPVELSGLQLLAAAATSPCPGTVGFRIYPDTGREQVSPVLQDSLVLPHAAEAASKRVHILDNLPDNVTSHACMRALGLRSLEKIKTFANKEKRAKEKFLSREAAGQTKKSFTAFSKEADSARPATSMEDEDAYCIGCGMSWSEDQELELGHVWVQCDGCNNWIHSHCSTCTIISDQSFLCPDCN